VFIFIFLWFQFVAQKSFMNQTLIECIANYSEGRRPEVIEAIASAILSVPQVHILDRHSDRDHNRSVITFVGALEEI